MSEAGSKEQKPEKDGGFDWRLAGTIVAGIAVVGLIAGLFFFGQELLSLEGESAAERLMGAGRGTLWAPVVAIVAFVILGLTGLPQFVLIAAAVLLFGPYYGFLYSWTGTMLSASLGFFLGHFFGADILRRFGGDRANYVSAMVGRRGILASALVRVVPSAPFIVVNMAAGVSHIKLSQFLMGTGIGIIPKMAFIAFIGGSLMSLAQGLNLWIIGAILAVIAVWIAGGLWLRRTYLGTRNGKPER